MNIDIRDIDSDFESDIRNIMQKNDIATASKAVRHAVTSFSTLEFENESLKRKLLKEQEKTRNLESFKSKILSFMDLCMALYSDERKNGKSDTDSHICISNSRYFFFCRFRIRFRKKNFSRQKNKIMELGYKIENDFCIRVSENRFKGEEMITFLHDKKEFKKYDYDWYMSVALEKADKVTKDRHQLTGKLIIAYRHAIREAYNHNLDKSMYQQWAHPSNRNTIAGIRGFIDKIAKIKEKQLNEFL